MTKDWLILLVAIGEPRDDEKRLAEILGESLEGDDAPAVLVEDGLADVEFRVTAPHVGRAAESALRAWHSATSGTALSQWDIVEFRVTEDRWLASDDALDALEPAFPSLVGVSELAVVLGVSKPRASVLARSRTFPAPVARLASGPVWLLDSVERHLQIWDRQPGRR